MASHHHLCLPPTVYATVVILPSPLCHHHHSPSPPAVSHFYHPTTHINPPYTTSPYLPNPPQHYPHCYFQEAQQRQLHKHTSLYSFSSIASTLELADLHRLLNPFVRLLPVLSTPLQGLPCTQVKNPWATQRSSFNNFRKELSCLKNLQVLDIYNNNMTDVIPIEVYLLTNLRHLRLGGNFFTGRIPSEYGRFLYLEYLAVSGNKLIGEIPIELGNLTRLKELYILVDYLKKSEICPS
ncbi:Uncharacterized protein Fot_15367 [Forsythia ovata]|uniref:Uncharacterized protein n=1 Tax=Forsythia ovata TaxID=205694 RepID=A0ABD1W8Y1_9LAMI